MKDVTFAAGNTPDQMFGAWINWRRWGLELEGIEIDDAGCINDWLAKQQSGTFLQIVGWDGCEPVAIVEIRLIYDSMLKRTTGYGDHAFVRADYRQEGVMTKMVDFCIQTASLMGLKRWVVPVTAGEQAAAPWLKDVYERAGFHLSGLTMSQQVP